ncbi:MAG: ABC transporter substrate-binding protein [Pelosinus sp.]|nr:ABC transporter substrate-binding protein [Pelosinus sp.]
MNKIFLAALLGICLVVSGCTGSTEKPKAAVEFATIQDSAGRTVILPKKPERIVVLSTSFLDLLYAVDGKAAGRVSSKTELVPEAAKNVPEVGFVYNVNIEKLVALQPDLVIAVEGMHEKLLPTLESNGIPVLIVKYKTLEDTLNTISLFGKVAGTEEKAQQLVADLQGKTAEIVKKVPDGKAPKAVILHATTKNVTIEQDTTIAGSIAKKLGVINVATADGAIMKDSDTVPYSLEKLVENNPDEIFVVTMGDVTEIKKRMNSDVENSPAWQTLKAVQQHKVYFLPSELFLVNPGLKMTTSVEYMAKLAYPEVFGHVE